MLIVGDSPDRGRAVAIVAAENAFPSARPIKSAIQRCGGRV